jgi:hypothetical protein
MKNRLAVQMLLALWGLCFVHVVYAATFAMEIKGFDYQSLMWGALAGLLGGTLRTIFTLASENRVVYSVLKEARKDLVVSFIAGGVAYLILLAVSSKWPDLITREIRVLAIGAAGWTRVAFFNRLNQLVTSKLDKTNQDLRAGAPVVPPASDVMPIGDK